MPRALRTGNRNLCGDVPLNLRGIVATYLNETTNAVQEIETLGACNGNATRPSTTPKQAPGPLPSAGPDTSPSDTNREPALGPTAPAESSASEPSARSGQASDMKEPAGPDRLQLEPLPAPAVHTMNVPALPPNTAQRPTLAAANPAASKVPMTQSPSSSMVRPVIACGVLLLRYLDCCMNAQHRF